MASCLPGPDGQFWLSQEGATCSWGSWLGGGEDNCTDYPAFPAPSSVMHVHLRVSQRLTRISEPGGQVVPWDGPVEPVNGTPRFSQDGPCFLLPANFYAVFSFLVHADVAVEVFKRALLPPFLFVSLDSGHSRFVCLAGVAWTPPSWAGPLLY